MAMAERDALIAASQRNSGALDAQGHSSRDFLAALTDFGTSTAVASGSSPAPAPANSAKRGLNV